MINVLQAVSIVWYHLNGGLLSTAISGGIYKDERPVDSEKEDVVINSLGLNAEQLQQGIINVNIHVPNIPNAKVNSIVSADIPNHTRLLALTTQALTELEEVWDPNGNYHFEVDQHKLFHDQGETFMNIRLKFYSINISN